ncbi:hypothetical protein BH09BAC2_BH09BAC2_02720 [soil metagenome]
MALNKQVFKTRALTAVVFAVVMLVALFSGGIVFIILFSVIHFGCWYEFVKLIRKISSSNYFAFIPLGLLYLTLPFVLFFMMAFPALSNFNAFKNMEFGKYVAVLPCGIFFSIWINDTMAYVVGSFIGKTPFSKISPKKTWEGTAGGALLCVAVAALVSNFINYFSVKDWIIIAAICAVFGTLGDLLESKLKRLAVVKDSGTFMPGHGGFLDRFDSFLLATPFVWLYVHFAML